MPENFLTLCWQNLAGDSARYVVTVGLALLVFWVWGRERFRHRLIRGTFPRRSDMRRELLYSARTIAIFAASGVMTMYGAHAGILRLYGHAHGAGWLYVALSIAMLIVLHDAYFYWTHRAMHSKAIYRWMHRAHHRSTNPSPCAAYAFAPAEAIVHALFVPLTLLIIPIHPIALITFLIFMTTRDVIGHLGMELHPRWFSRGKLLGFCTTTTHHSMHHTHFEGNYGLYFTWWDRWLGTMRDDYDSTFEQMISRSPAPRSSLFDAEHT